MSVGLVSGVSSLTLILLTTSIISSASSSTTISAAASTPTTIPTVLTSTPAVATTLHIVRGDLRLFLLVLGWT